MTLRSDVLASVGPIAEGVVMEGMPFGRYRLVELLGRGGMGEVWRAQDAATNNRTVAIKLLPPHLAADPKFVQRFRREADAAAMLNNPHIIPIHNYGEIDGRLYVDMRLIDGRDLETVLHDDGSLNPGRAVSIIGQVAKALHAAHKVGLIHRDVKPSNILVDEDDFAYLIDFGIARALDSTRLTNTGHAIGTFQYMAPERLGAAGEEDARADTYALACVLHECLTGHPPYASENLANLVAAHLNTPPPRPSSARPDLPRRFDDVIAKGLAKHPDARYPTTVALAQAARMALTPVGPRRSPSSIQPPPRVYVQQLVDRAQAASRLDVPTPNQPLPEPVSVQQNESVREPDTRRGGDRRERLDRTARRLRGSIQTLLADAPEWARRTLAISAIILIGVVFLLIAVFAAMAEALWVALLLLFVAAPTAVAVYSAISPDSELRPGQPWWHNKDPAIQDSPPETIRPWWRRKKYMAMSAAVMIAVAILLIIAFAATGPQVKRPPPLCQEVGGIRLCTAMVDVHQVSSGVPSHGGRAAQIKL